MSATDYNDFSRVTTHERLFAVTPTGTPNATAKPLLIARGGRRWRAPLLPPVISRRQGAPSGKSALAVSSAQGSSR